MKILLTGSSGRIGRAIFGALAAAHEVVGLDRSPFATTRIIADVSDRQAVARAVQGVDAVIHTAALHAPHVGLVPDAVFQQINVEATAHLLQAAREAGARRFVLTSTTALYGHAVVAGGCRWIDEDTEPLPRTIYHRTKLQAETLAEGTSEAAAQEPEVQVTSNTLEERRKAFRDMVAGEYKDVYTEETQRIIDRRFAEFNALEMASEWIKHTYHNGYELPPMPAGV